MRYKLHRSLGGNKKRRKNNMDVCVVEIVSKRNLKESWSDR